MSAEQRVITSLSNKYHNMTVDCSLAWVPEEMAQAASVRRPLPVMQWAILAKPLGPGYKLHVAIIPLVKKGPGTRGKGKRICIGASNGEVTT